MSFEPKILGILCNWCSYTGADQAGQSKIEYFQNISVVRVMCSGRFDPTFVLTAFKEGADGVLIAGCHFGDCHYKEGNYKAQKRFKLMMKTLKEFNIDVNRVRLEWISASEGSKYAAVVNEFTDTLRKLGPANYSNLLERKEEHDG